MFKLTHFHAEDMALALIIKVCTLPLVTLVVAPLLGARVGGTYGFDAVNRYYGGLLGCMWMEAGPKG